ncbi:MAG: Trk system potassium transporter TrkA [Holosporales bacterium]|jgi:trk system potassium uptake protein TrkA|nr:Trk system potassium transporter TrkA [Holosporales bacterium]
MKVVIFGAGRVGYEIAKQLSFEEYNVSIVDYNKEILRKINEKLDVKAVYGDIVDLAVLEEAGADEADIVIATTSSDETNIVACQIASFIFGVETKIAVLSNKSYIMNAKLFGKNKFAIDMKASPEIEISSIIVRSLSVYGALDVISCIDNRLRIVGVQCTRKTSFINAPIRSIHNVSNNAPIAILFIERDGKSFIPRKTTIIMDNDKVYLVIKQEDLNKIMELFGYSERVENRVLLVGGGKIAEEIAKSVQGLNTDISVKIIERNMKRAEELSEDLQDIEIIHGDALDFEILSESIADGVNTVISTTGDDKKNILSCLLAKKCGARKIAAMVNSITNIPLLQALGINTILDSRKAIVSKILHYIKNGNVDNVFTFADDSIEIFIINIVDSSRAIGVLIEDICPDETVAVSCLVREDKVHMTPKRMVINAGDKIVLVSSKDSVHKINNLFKEKPKYLY